MPKVMKRSRSWIFVINNYSSEDIAKVESFAAKCVYLVYGLEVGASGTPHIQGYLYFKSASWFSRVKKAFPTAHLEPAKGSPEQNRVYCSKDGNFQSFGELPVMGARNDIESFVQTVRESKDKLDEDTLLLHHSSLVARYPLFVDRVQRHFHKPEPLKEIENLWYHGPPGTGKTVTAKQLGTFFIKGPNKWFDGYTDQDILIVEDIEPQHAKFISWFLKIWADYEPFTAQVKGSSLFIRPKRIVVTSNYSIGEMGWDGPTVDAIRRRFTSKYFGEKFCYPKDLVRS